MDTDPREPVMFRAIDVWRRVDETHLVRFRCFQSLSTERYCVQSADSYHLPLSPAECSALDRQFLELLAEQPPDERDETFASLAEAIARHEQDFAGLFDDRYHEISGAA